MQTDKYMVFKPKKIMFKPEHFTEDMAGLLTYSLSGRLPITF